MFFRMRMNGESIRSRCALNFSSISRGLSATIIFLTSAMFAEKIEAVAVFIEKDQHPYADWLKPPDPACDAERS